MKLVTAVLLAAGMAIPAARGGTVIESHDDVGGITTVKIQGYRARIETGDDSGYMLIHMKPQKVYSVSNDDRMVLDASSPADAGGSGGGGAAPTPTVTKVGKGPVIAGYPTVQYRVSVGDVHCFDDYLAPGTLRNKEILHFTETMSEWSGRLRKAGQVPGEEDECDAVADALNGSYPKLGIPMRTVDTAGTVVHEITRIQTGDSFPAGLFELPRSYPVVTQQQLLERVQKLENGDALQAPSGQLDEMQEDTGDMLRRLLEQQ